MVRILNIIDQIQILSFLNPIPMHYFYVNLLFVTNIDSISVNRNRINNKNLLIKNLKNILHQNSFPYAVSTQSN